MGVIVEGSEQSIKNQKEINYTRKECGLPPMKIKTRNCSGCGAEFVSYGVANRLCTICGKKDPDGLTLY